MDKRVPSLDDMPEVNNTKTLRDILSRLKDFSEWEEYSKEFDKQHPELASPTLNVVAMLLERAEKNPK